eukprot:TRINITY_DN1269_c0_g1_i1.p1 TRINITY_DN1269_c0_g1~~TRINITY_DN1269_c0_g1_i1.p1  ORF type:complete len:668 (+),score=140.27 TRINITY_DN1269_c0_g1_i1:77-2080(+)
MSIERDPKNIFKILVCSDTHLGHLENDVIRKDDSFLGFEECLRVAKHENVDLILNSGDLFHTSSPSNNTQEKANDLLIKYCFGDSKPQFDLETSSNQPINFISNNPIVSIPFFAIHGNHDDPAEIQRKSPLHVLAASKVINYIGRQPANSSIITLRPIILTKGYTRIAIYGLSYIREERLFRLLRERKINIVQPSDPENVYSILLIHQNRIPRTSKNYFSLEFLQAYFPFVDFVLWGHEHDVEIEPRTYFGNVQICQPGSTTVTTLKELQSQNKHCGILYVHKLINQPNQFETMFEKVPLLHTRPLLFIEIIAEDIIQTNQSEKSISESLKQIVIDALGENISSWRNHIEQAHKRAKLWNEPICVEHTLDDFESCKNLQLWLPLVRLRIVGHLISAPKVRAFGSQFNGMIANPESLLLLSNKRKKHSARIVNKRTGEIVRETDISQEESVLSILRKVLSESSSFVMSNRSFWEACEQFDTGATDAFSNLTQNTVKTMKKLLGKQLRDLNITKEQLHASMEDFVAKEDAAFNQVEIEDEEEVDDKITANNNVIDVESEKFNNDRNRTDDSFDKFNLEVNSVKTEESESFLHLPSTAEILNPTKKPPAMNTSKKAGKQNGKTDYQNENQKTQNSINRTILVNESKDLDVTSLDDKITSPPRRFQRKMIF